jgi:hypothetical protein
MTWPGSGLAATGSAPACSGPSASPFSVDERAVRAACELCVTRCRLRKEWPVFGAGHRRTLRREAREQDVDRASSSLGPASQTARPSCRKLARPIAPRVGGLFSLLRSGAAVKSGCARRRRTFDSCRRYG